MRWNNNNRYQPRLNQQGQKPPEWPCPSDFYTNTSNNNSCDEEDDHNSIVEEEPRNTPEAEPNQPPVDKKRAAPTWSPTTSISSSTNRVAPASKRRKVGRGRVSTTLLGPAAAFVGGRRQWLKMERHVRSLKAAENSSSNSSKRHSPPTLLPAQMSELV